MRIKKRKSQASIRDNLLTGFFVLAPIGAVAWIVLWLWDILIRIADVYPTSMHPVMLFEIENQFLAGLIDVGIILFMFALVLVLIWGVGFLSRYYLGKKILGFIRRSLGRLPVLNTVYSTLEQLLETFSAGKTKNFRRVVRIEYPRKGIFTLALVTGESPNQMLSIFVPTTPNPTSGFYLSIAASETEELDLSVEDALKEIISMGLVRKDSNRHGSS